MLSKMARPSGSSSGRGMTRSPRVPSLKGLFGFSITFQALETSDMAFQETTKILSSLSGLSRSCVSPSSSK